MVQNEALFLFLAILLATRRFLALGCFLYTTASQQHKPADKPLRSLSLSADKDPDQEPPTRIFQGVKTNVHLHGKKVNLQDRPSSKLDPRWRGIRIRAAPLMPTPPLVLFLLS